MLLSIFLLLYSEGVVYRVRACLSNPQRTCSVASYQYSAACRAQIDAAPQQVAVAAYPLSLPPQEDKYQGFLGHGVQARVYSERGRNADFARVDAQLQCFSTSNCTWRNIDDDELEWVVGEGQVDPVKLSLITGSTVLPDNNFFLLASDPKPPFQGGMLASLPIGCQQSIGVLTFRFWRSRARTIGYEPDLDICTRKVLETALENCLTITPTENHTIVASIPPLLEPFEIVIRGYGFENEPEGGLIIIDQLDYIAHLDMPENCASKPIDDTEIENFVPLTDEEKKALEEHDAPTIISGDTEKEKMSTVSHDVKQHDVKTVVKNDDELPIVILNKTTESDKKDLCRSIQCFFGDEPNLCDYRRVGTDSGGNGFRLGWKATTVRTNLANPLTGVHETPGIVDDKTFLVADFPGFQKIRERHVYVLESPSFTMAADAPVIYMSFKKYIATKGLGLKICEDSTENRCFWNVSSNSAEPFVRRWTREVVLLPGNLTKVFFISTQHPSEKANEGQVGLTQIGLHSDSLATQNWC